MGTGRRASCAGGIDFSFMRFVMPERFGYVPCGAEVAYAEQDYYLWDGSVVFAEGR